jgi:peptide/nickel transport system substrate-binding protein
MKPRFLSLCAAVLAMSALLAASAFPAPQPANQAVIAMWGLPTRLLGTTEAVGGYVWSFINEALVRVVAGGQAEGRLAERWERSADGKTWTMHLRAAQFQDGRPVTAADVKFSYEFYLHPRYPFTRAALFEIDGGRAFKQGRATDVPGLQVVDPRTIRFVLNRRVSFFLEDIAGSPHYVLPRHGLEGVDMTRMLEHPFARRPIGAGPYRLTDWRDRESMSFTAFAGHWAGRPGLERIILRLVPEPAAVMAELRAGNLDAGQVLPDEFDAFQRERNLKTIRMPGDLHYWFSFNHTHPFFSDVRVRRAMYHAVDREAMVRVLQKGFGSVVHSPVHPSLRQFNASARTLPYNPDRARELLREAGFSPGPGGLLQRDGAPFRVRYTFLSEKRYQDQGLMIQQFLRQVGVEITLEPLERGDFFGRYWQFGNQANIEMVGLASFNLILPVQSELEFTFNANPHMLLYRNAEIDGLLNQAVSATDPGAQRAMYFRVQEVIAQDVPLVMTFRPDELWAVRRSLTLPRIDSLAGFFLSLPKWRAAP